MNEIKPNNSLATLLRAIDDNQALSTELNTDHVNEYHLPAELLQHLEGLRVQSDDCYTQWNNFLNSLCLKHKAQRLFTTFEHNKSDISKIHHDFKKSGSGMVRLNETSLELVTISDQTARLSFDKIPQNESIVVHLLGNFRSNLQDNLYLEFGESQDGEAIRFGNTAVSHTTSCATILCNTKIDKLYTVVINKAFCKVYLNGILYICKKRTVETMPNTLHLKLVGSLGADLSAAIKGMELWSATSSIDDLHYNENALFLKRLHEYIEHSELVKIHELLNNFDGFDISIAEDKLLHLLSDELHNQQGYKEWIFEKLLSRVSPENIDAWYKKNVGKFPQAILEVKNLDVEFYRTPNTRFSIGKILKLKKQNKFKVLDNINFNVFPGDIIGIVGANGAGKSTLLKTISGMVPINNGSINLFARHLLLSAGLGARNELTGRENIYLSGCFMGLNKNQIDALYEEIVDFSELGEAIDRPFKYYSDGMKGRLVFSIATSVSPNILMLDELLSAGDIKFQQKAAKRMDQLIKRAKVVVVVTHSTHFVLEKCNKALLLSHGKQIYYGDPGKAIALYLNELHMQPDDQHTDLGPTNITIQQQMNQSIGMPMGGQRVN